MRNVGIALAACTMEYVCKRIKYVVYSSLGRMRLRRRRRRDDDLIQVDST